MGVAPIFAIKRRRLWFVVPVLGVHLAMLYGLVSTNTVESNPEAGQPPLEVHLITAPAPEPAALAPARLTDASSPKMRPFDGRKPAAAPTALVSCQGSNVACSLVLKPDGVVASRRHSPRYDSSSRLASGLDGGAIKRHFSPDATLVGNLSRVSPEAMASSVHAMQNGTASVSPADAPSEPAAVTATGVPAAGSTGRAAPLLPGSGGAVGSPSAALMAAMGQKSMAIGVVCPTQVKPVMPRRAEREGLQGVVNARITLQAGRVIQVEIVSAQPRGVFDAAVRSAIEQYRCESPADVAVVTTQVFEFNAAPLP